MNIRQLFPRSVITDCHRIKEDYYELYPAERLLIEKAVAKRRIEFAAGRTCARRALMRLGISGYVLTREPDGAPLWPPGIVGSISHNDILAGSAVARLDDIKGVGLDIETVRRITPGIANKILSTFEKGWISARPAQEHQKWSACIFSAKEAVYKCLAPLAAKPIHFHDADIVPVAKQNVFNVRLNDIIVACISSGFGMHGRYFFKDGCVFTGVVLTP